MVLKIKRGFRAFCLCGIAVLTLAGGFGAAAVAYVSCVYAGNRRSVPSPPDYPAAAAGFGAEAVGRDWENPMDIAAAGEVIALLDNGRSGVGSCVYLMDRDFHLVRTIQSFENDGKEDALSNAQGIFLTGDKLYVADTGNGRILVFSLEGELLHEFGRPDTDMLEDSLNYQPKKLAVDDAGRMYVVAVSVNQGLIELESDGSFLRYMGANAVRYNLIEYIWRAFSTEEQLERMNLFVPTEYTNLSIDGKGFLFAVNGTSADSLSDSSIVKRLNPKGNNVLKQNGYVPPVGDILDGKIYSVMVDVDVHPSGVYALLDSISGRVFLYDPDGNLLSAFGGTGEREGLTQVPVAVCYSGDRLLVVDSFWKAVLQYDLTPYGESVQSATALYETGAYEASAAQWRQVLLYNANSDLAYTGIGKVALRTGDYETAADCFRLSEQRLYYSKAYKQYRRQQLGVYFPYVAVVLLILIALLLIRKAFKRGKALLRKLSSGYEKQ